MLPHRSLARTHAVDAESIEFVGDDLGIRLRPALSTGGEHLTSDAPRCPS